MKKVQKIQMGITVSKTFQEGFEEYILDCKARNLRQGTIIHYQNSIKQIYKFFPQNMKIADFDEKAMPQFIISLRENPHINDVSMGTYTRDLKTLLKFFMKCKYLPLFEVKIPHTDKEPTEIYTDEELRILLKKPDIKSCSFAIYRSWVIVNFLLSTGIRQNSLIHIKNKDIDFENSMVSVNVTKNRKILMIPLNEDIIKILREYMRFRGGRADDWLFCSIYGRQLTRSSCYHAIWDYNHGRGLEKTGMHRFRHTFAKKWVTMGGSVVTLQKILGHSSLAITENYLNILMSDLQKDMEKINILKSLKREYIQMAERKDRFN